MYMITVNTRLYDPLSKLNKTRTIISEISRCLAYL